MDSKDIDSKAPTIKCLKWQLPLVQVMKINVDVGASGAPGGLTGGGVSRDSFGVFRGCFAMNHGRGFAFESELVTAFYAIELANDNGWQNIWREYDSLYVVQIFRSSNSAIPWHLMAQNQEDYRRNASCCFSYFQGR
ncbi:hypothetical protein ACS0TY_011157 [Phlomoides rotata]